MAKRQFEILRELDATRITELRQRGDFFWVDLATRGGPSATQIAEVFGLDPLATETLEKFHGTGAPARKIHVDEDLIVFAFWCSATPESERHADHPLDLLRVNVVLHG